MLIVFFCEKRKAKWKTQKSVELVTTDSNLIKWRIGEKNQSRENPNISWTELA